MKAHSELPQMQGCPLERCIIRVINEVMTSNDVITRQGPYVHFVSDISNNRYVPGTFMTLA